MEEANLLREKELINQHCKAIKDQVMKRIGRILENLDKFNLAIQELTDEMKEDGDEISDDDVEEFRSVAKGKIVEIEALEENIEEQRQKLCAPTRPNQDLSEEQLVKWNAMKATYTELSDSLTQLKIRWEASLQSLEQLMINGELNGKQNQTSEPKVVQDEANPIEPSRLEAVSAQGLGKEAEIATPNDGLAKKTEMVPGSSRQMIDSKNLDEPASKTDGGNALSLRDTMPSATEKNRKDTKKGFTKEISVNEYNMAKENCNGQISNILEVLHGRMKQEARKVLVGEDSTECKEFWRLAEQKLCELKVLHTKVQSQREIFLTSGIASPKMPKPHPGGNANLNQILDDYFELFGIIVELESSLESRGLFKGDELKLSDYEGIYEALTDYKTSKIGWDQAEFGAADCFLIKQIHSRLLWVTEHWKTDDDLLAENLENVVKIKSDDAIQSDVDAPGESGNVEENQSETGIHADVAGN